MVKRKKRKMTAAQKLAFVRRMKKARGITSRSKTKKRGVKMVRKRKVSRRRSNKMKMFGGNAAALVGAALYGGVRARISNALSPITARIPLGNVSDEAALIVAAFAAKKMIGNKIPLVKEISKAGILIEAARVGEAVATGQVGLGGNVEATNGGNIF